MSDRWTQSWRDMLGEEMAEHGESLADVIASAPPISSAGMTTPFDTSFGAENGCAFTVWTNKRVYFPVGYDGAESVASVSRDPNGETTSHVGG